MNFDLRNNASGFNVGAIGGGAASYDDDDDDDAGVDFDDDDSPSMGRDLGEHVLHHQVYESIDEATTKARIDVSPVTTARVR